MVLADMPVRVQGDSKTLHVADHNRYATAFNQAVYSAEYPTLQAAIDAAASKARPLVIEPKIHTLPPVTPLTLNNLNGFHVFAYGAMFVTSGDMPTMLDMKDCIYCSWHGGRFKVNPGHVVDNAIYIYKDVLRSSHIDIVNMRIEGDYTVGLRIGKQLDNFQCDDMSFSNLTVTGASNKAGQVGVYCGTGSYSNCLNHHFYNVSSASNETNFLVDNTNVYVHGGEFGHAAVDLDVRSISSTFRNLRCEGSQRFFVAKGYSSYYTQILIEDVMWTGENIAADGKWIQSYHAGILSLNRINLSNPAHPPIIDVMGGSPVRVKIDGLAVPVPAAEAFLLGTNASVKGDYIQDSPTGVVSITTL